MKKILLLTAAVLALSSTAAQRVVVGEKTPDIKISEWLAGKPADSSLPTLLEFFHSSSRQSIDRLPLLEEYAAGYEGQLNVVVVTREPEDLVSNTLLPAPRKYYVAFDDGIKTFENYGVRYVPYGVLIDSRGRVAWFGNPVSLDRATIEKVLE